MDLLSMHTQNTQSLICAVHKTVGLLRYVVILERQEPHLDDNLVIVPLLSV